MSSISLVSQPSPSTRLHPGWLIAGASLYLALVIVASMVKPIGLLLVAIVLPVAIALMVWPNLTTLSVIFLIYTNASVVAVKSHGVPYFVGAGVPLLLCIPVAYYVVWRGQRLIVDRVALLVILLLLAYAASACCSYNVGTSVGSVINLATEGLLLYVLVVNAVRSTRALAGITWILLLAGTVMGSLSVVQYATKSYRRDYGGFARVEQEHPGFRVGPLGAERQPRLAGPLGEQNRYAQVMLMLIPIGIFRIWNERLLIRRIAAGTATAVIAAGCVLTFSRGAAVGLVAVLGVMVWLRVIRPTQCLWLVAGAALLLIAIPQYSSRMASLSRAFDATHGSTAAIAAADSSIRSRAGEVMAAFLMFVDHPLTGVGPGVYPALYQQYALRVGVEFLPGITVQKEMRQPHMLYLGLAAEAGLPSLLLFLYTVAVALQCMNAVRRQCLPEQRELAGIITSLMLALVAYLATGFFLHFAYVRYFWLMLALGLAACHIAADTAARSRAAPEHQHPRRRFGFE